MTDKQPATPVPAATILLLRDSAEGMQVFMVVRHHQIDFASGALVFPGGKADEADFDAGLTALMDGAADNSAQRAVQVAAIREAFEECGVLLARVSGESGLISSQQLQQLSSYRDRLNNGDITMLDFLRAENLRLACDQLTFFSHWITPDMMPKRFDTYFYLAPAPADQIAIHDGHESVDSVWITPMQAMQDGDAGSRTVIFPTYRNLEKLGFSDTTESAIQAAASTPVVSVLPWTEKREDGNYLCIPPEAGYAISEEKMPERPRG